MAIDSNMTLSATPITHLHNVHYPESQPRADLVRLSCLARDDVGQLDLLLHLAVLLSRVGYVPCP